MSQSMSDKEIGEQVLALPMQENDADAKTIGEYLVKLLKTLWANGEGFSGKRPFGNSGWDYELYYPLVKARFVRGTVDGDFSYNIENCDKKAADKLINKAIDSLLK